MSPADPRAERNAMFGRVLLAPLLAVAVTAVAGMFVGEPWQDRLARVTIVVLIVVPILRVVWLITRWARRRDDRFVAAGMLLLAVIALGIAVAAW